MQYQRCPIALPLPPDSDGPAHPWVCLVVQGQWLEPIRRHLQPRLGRARQGASKWSCPWSRLSFSWTKPSSFSSSSSKEACRQLSTPPSPLTRHQAAHRCLSGTIPITPPGAILSRLGSMLQARALQAHSNRVPIQQCMAMSGLAKCLHRAGQPLVVLGKGTMVAILERLGRFRHQGALSRLHSTADSMNRSCSMDPCAPIQQDLPLCAEHPWPISNLV